MKSNDIERLVENIHFQPSDAADKRIVTRAEAALEKPTPAKQNPWRTIIHSRIIKLATAAVVIIGVFVGLRFSGGSLDFATPAFAQVVDNVLSQKWVYMFQEDRKSGQIKAEYWYSPQEKRQYTKLHIDEGIVGLFDMNLGETYEYRAGILTIRRPDDPGANWLGRRIPTLSDLLDRFELEGADIVQKEAVYNSEPALLYEIEITLPDGSSLRTDKYTWLVDRQTHLPIICEHTQGYSSQRYAFDYSDTGPTDIYDLGVPADTNVVDERPSPQIQQIIDNINQLKQTRYDSFAAVIVEKDIPNRLIIKDGTSLRDEYSELEINYSDWEPKKEQYRKAMGETFDSIYQWLNKTNILKRQHIIISDELFSYQTNDSDIEENVPIEIIRLRRTYNHFNFYCWRSMPSGQIVVTPYSQQNNLICTQNKNGRRYYYDPQKDYMCVRNETKQGHIYFDVLEFSTTSSGMWYPSKILDDSSQIHIYAKDMNDELRATLDPQSLPNYLDHRELTRQMKMDRQKDPNESSLEYTGFTPLHMAIYRQDFDKVAGLLEQGAELKPEYDRGATPMELAAASGNLEMVKLLRKHGAEFISSDGEHRYALGAAAMAGYTDVVKYMLDEGADVNGRYKRGNTALHYAALSGDIEMIKLLLERGADANIKNSSGGITPLFDAAGGSISICISSQTWKPQHQQKLDRFVEAGRLLLEAGADVNAKDFSGTTPLLFMAQPLRSFKYPNAEFFKLIVDGGADVNYRRKDLPTALISAVKANRLEITKILLEAGADPFAETGRREYRIALDIARNRPDNNEMIKLLQQYMEPKLSSDRKAITAAVTKLLRNVRKHDYDNATCIDRNYPDMKGRQETPGLIAKFLRSVPGAKFLPRDLVTIEVWKLRLVELSKAYRGHYELFDEVLEIRSQNGWAEAAIKRPDSDGEKYLILELMEFPDGNWKVVCFSNAKKFPLHQVPAYSARSDSERYRHEVFKAAVIPLE